MLQIYEEMYKASSSAAVDCHPSNSPHQPERDRQPDSPTTNQINGNTKPTNNLSGPTTSEHCPVLDKEGCSKQPEVK